MLAFLTTEGIFMVSFMLILKLNPKKWQCNIPALNEVTVLCNFESTFLIYNSVLAAGILSSASP